MNNNFVDEEFKNRLTRLLIYLIDVINEYNTVYIYYSKDEKRFYTFSSFHNIIDDDIVYICKFTDFIILNELFKLNNQEILKLTGLDTAPIKLQDEFLLYLAKTKVKGNINLIVKEIIKKL